jgi:DNA-binding PadR family transcriptional regulator
MIAGMSEPDRPENPLALAMMAMLAEAPMHPYEVASTLRTRHGEDSIKIRFGSLYTVIGQLVRRGWIVAHKTAQTGNRPEHTQYRLTEAGREALSDWLSEMIAAPAKEYPKFEAALCLHAVLSEAEVARLLERRVTALSALGERLAADIQRCLNDGLDPLFLIEADYRLAMQRTEQDFCERLATTLHERARDDGDAGHA